MSDYGRDRARRGFNTSLRKVGLDYIDLYLLHWPMQGCKRLARLALFSVCIALPAQQDVPSSVLHYDSQTRSAAPIPPAERGLQTVRAEQWFKVPSAEPMLLEGPAFERNGGLVFSDIKGGRVLRISPAGSLSTVFTQPGLGPAGIAIHKDGRIFIAGTGDVRTPGTILAIKPDGSGLETIIPTSAGFSPNDLVFADDGGFYFSDFRGSSTEATGGIYYVSADFKRIEPVLPRLAQANGVALSPDGKCLWATEFDRNLLHRVELESATKATPFGTAIPYHFTGIAPDSMRVDSDGNVYVAMVGQGRILILNRLGIPIGQVLLPGREEGHNLYSTSLALKPGTDELYIVASDGTPGTGAAIFRAKVFAPALSLYSHK